MTGSTVQVAVRLPEPDVERMDALVGTLHESRSEIIRRALELYLYRLECERDAQHYAAVPLTAQESAFVDDDTTWSATPEW